MPSFQVIRPAPIPANPLPHGAPIPIVENFAVHRQRPIPGFCDLPGELRNQIYAHVLGDLRKITPRNAAKSRSSDPRFNIFRVHHAIYKEAHSYFLDNSSVLLPIQGGKLPWFPLGGNSPEYKATYIKALRDMRSFHLHLRFSFTSLDHQDKISPYLDNMYSTLEELRQYSLLEHNGRRRRVLIHLASRRYNRHPKYLPELLQALGRNPLDDFTICYYVQPELSTFREQEEVDALILWKDGIVNVNLFRHTAYGIKDVNIRLRVEVLGPVDLTDAEWGKGDEKTRAVHRPHREWWVDAPAAY